jgi:7-keto-8-aminopelargonate synthetase-like enzyme
MLGACGGYIVAHHRAWNAATAHYSAVVNSCLSANTTLADTTKQLQAANDQWANASKADAEKLSEAAAQLKAASKSNAKALATAQAKLKQVIHDKGDAHAWGVTTVPAGVIDALGVRHADGQD